MTPLQFEKRYENASLKELEALEKKLKSQEKKLKSQRKILEEKSTAAYKALHDNDEKMCIVADSICAQKRRQKYLPYVEAIEEFNNSTDSFYIWKAVWLGQPSSKDREIRIVCRLIVPEKAKRIMCADPYMVPHSDTGLQSYPCRVSRAIVDGYEDLLGGEISVDHNTHRVSSNWDSTFEYPPVGGIVKPRYRFNSNPMRDCVSGIYGYTNRGAV